MAAAEITESCVGSTVGNGASASAAGLVSGVYNATIVTTADWIIFDDFAEVKYVKASVLSSGADNVCVIDGTTKNKVTVTTTGATTFFVVGTPKA